MAAAQAAAPGADPDKQRQADEEEERAWRRQHQVVLLQAELDLLEEWAMRFCANRVGGAGRGAGDVQSLYEGKSRRTRTGWVWRSGPCPPAALLCLKADGNVLVQQGKCGRRRRCFLQGQGLVVSAMMSSGGRNQVGRMRLPVWAVQP